jgi:tetratricopeptide (TPR) repeat protein/ppGpp synthetase/RelA/SpoT-type nucleotidyltranferase
MGMHSYPHPQTISHWELGRYQPDANKDRNVLVSLVAVLAECGGIESLEDGDALLASGGYAALTDEEQLQVFGPSTQPRTVSAAGGIQSRGPGATSVRTTRFSAPVVAGFVGRAKELLRLSDAFSRKHIVSLLGLPGVGKTWLAATYSANVQETRLICWLDVPGTSPEQITFSLNEFLRELGDHSFEKSYGGFENEYDDRDPQWNATLKELVQHLSRHRCLIVLDNFAGRYRDFVPFLLAVTQQRGDNIKTLLISRFSDQYVPLKLANDICEVRVNGLEMEDTYNYLQTLQQDSDLPPFNRQQLSQLFKATSGHPLAMNLALLWLRRGTPLRRVVREIGELDRRSGSQLEHLVGAILPVLSEPERLCLTRLSVFESSVSSRVVGYLDIDDLDSLDRLLLWRLVTRVGTEQIQVHGLLRKLLYADLPAKESWHLRAGQFYEEEAATDRGSRVDSLVQAIRQYRLASDQDRALDAANLLAETLFREDVLPSERLLSLRDWLTSLASTDLSARPWLGIQVARTADYERDFNHARKCLELAGSQFRARNEPIGLLAASYYEAKILSCEKELEKSLELFEAAFELAERTGSKVAQVRILRKISDIHNVMGRYDDAQVYSDWTLSLARDIGDTLGEVLALYLKGNISRRRGEFREAYRAFEQALRLFSGDGEHSGVIYDPYLESKILCRQGVVCTYLGQLEEAGQHLEQSTDIKDRIGDQYGLAIGVDHLGDVAYFRGEYSEAAKLYGSARVIREALEDSYGLKKSQNNLGRLWTRMGKSSDAAELLGLQGAIPSRQQLVQADGADGTQLTRRGQLLYTRGRFRDSIRSFIASIRIFEHLGVNHSQAIAVLGLARALLAMGHILPARRWLSEALMTAEDCGFSLLEAQCYDTIAGLACFYDRGEGDLDFALEKSRQAIQILKRIGAQYDLLLAERTATLLQYQDIVETGRKGAFTEQAHATASRLAQLANSLDRLEGTSDAARLRVQQLLLSTRIGPRGRRRQVSKSALDTVAAQLIRDVFSRDAFRVLLRECYYKTRILARLPDQVATHLAQDGLQVYGPLAQILGMNEMEAAIEDSSFCFLYPDEFERIYSHVESFFPDPQTYLAVLKKELERLLLDKGAKAEVSTRVKHVYSIYRKERARSVDLSQILDIVGARIITESEEDCYRVYSAIMQEFELYEASFLREAVRDYIARPKASGYRSIHFNIQRGDGRVAEVQIRTREMHQEVELGGHQSSHFHYKLGDRYRRPSRKRLFRRKLQVRFDLKGHRRAVEMVSELVRRGDVVLMADKTLRRGVHLEVESESRLHEDNDYLEVALEGSITILQDELRTLTEFWLKLADPIKESLEERVFKFVLEEELEKAKRRRSGTSIGRRERTQAKAVAEREGRLSICVGPAVWVTMQFHESLDRVAREDTVVRLYPFLGEMRDEVKMLEPLIIEETGTAAKCKLLLSGKEALERLRGLTVKYPMCQ